MTSKKATTTNLFRALVLSFIYSLSSCGFLSKYSKRTNIFYPGSFQGIDEYNNEISCYFNVEEIDKDQYGEANGINVIQDLVSLKYYALEFYAVLEDGSKKSYELKNFSDAYKGATGTKIAYVDENNVWLVPFVELDQDSISANKCCYSIHTAKPKDNLEIYTNLYLKEV